MNEILADDAREHSQLEFEKPNCTPTGKLTRGGKQLFRLNEDFGVVVGKHRFIVRKGFHFDFASVPRFFERFLSANACQGTAAVAHDWLYFIGASKEQADQIFYTLMKAEGIPAWQRKVMAGCVLIFGKKAYRNHRRLKHPLENSDRFE